MKLEAQKSVLIFMINYLLIRMPKQFNGEKIISTNGAKTVRYPHKIMKFDLFSDLTYKNLLKI